MAGENVIELIIRLKTEGTEAIGRAQSSLDRWHNSLTGGQGIISGYTRSLVGLAAAYVSFHGLYNLAQGFFETAKAAQSAQRNFEILLGSTTAATHALEFLHEAAKKTPFTFAEMREAGRTLAVMRLDLEKWTPAVANLAAYMGTDLPNAASALGRGLVSGTEGFRQLRHAGILPVIEEMARLKFGVDDLSKLSLPQLREATLAALSDPEGRIAKAAEQLSTGWRGMVARLKDTWEDFQKKVMSLGAWDKLKATLGEVKKKVDEWAASGQMELWAKRVGESVAWVIDKLTALGKWLWEHKKAIGEAAAAYAGFKVGKIVLGELLGVAASLLETVTSLSQVKLSNLAMLGKGAAGMAAGIAGWKIGEAIQDKLQWGPLYESKQAEKAAAEAEAMRDRLEAKYQAALAARKKAADEATLAALKQAEAEKAVQQAQEAEAKTLNEELIKAVEEYAKAQETLRGALEETARAQLALTQQVAKETGDVGAGVDAKLLELKKTAAEQLAIGMDPALVLQAFMSALATLKTEVETTAAEAWGKWETEGGTAARATAQAAQDALARIATLNDGLEQDLRQGTIDTLTDIQTLWDGYLSEIEARLNQIDAFRANPVVELIDNASSKIQAIIDKLNAIPRAVSVEMNLSQYTVTVPVASRAMGEWRTTEGLRYVHDDELIAPAPLANRLRAALTSEGGGDVNIYITEKIDRGFVRRVLIPEIKRAQSRA